MRREVWAVASAWHGARFTGFCRIISSHVSARKFLVFTPDADSGRVRNSFPHANLLDSAWPRTVRIGSSSGACPDQFMRQFIGSPGVFDHRLYGYSDRYVYPFSLPAAVWSAFFSGLSR